MEEMTPLKGSVGRTAWDLLHDLLGSKSFVVSAVGILALALASIHFGYVRAGFNEKFYFEVGKPATDQTVEKPVSYTHVVSTVCKNDDSSSRGINLRFRPLSDAELAIAKEDALFGEQSLIGPMDNGHKVMLVENVGKWHKVVTVLNHERRAGYISSLCSSRPTLSVIP